MNLLTVKQVATKLSCSESTVWNLLKTDPSFPRSIKLSETEARGRGTRWVDESINAWIARKEGAANDDGRTGPELHQAA